MAFISRLFSDGIHQADLYTLVADINTKLIALYTQLVADTTVNTATYTANTPGALPHGISGSGIAQSDIVAWLQRVITGWNANMALLDADTGVTATNYVATHAITDAINPTLGAAYQIRNNGMKQSDMIYWLNTIITEINAVMIHLDADSLQLSDYASLFSVTDNVDV